MTTNPMTEIWGWPLSYRERARSEGWDVVDDFTNGIEIQSTSERMSNPYARHFVASKLRDIECDEIYLCAYMLHQHGRILLRADDKAKARSLDPGTSGL